MPTITEISQMMVDGFIPEKAQGTNAVIQFSLSGDNGGEFWVHINDGTVTTGEGTHDAPNMTLKADADDWVKVSTGEMNAMQAFMTGKIKIQGDMSLAMKMQSMFKTG